MADPHLTIVLPYFNEENWIGRTLASLAKQTDRRFSLVLVDNGSTDASSDAAKAALVDAPDLSVLWLHEPTPGKIHALRTGTHAATTPYVATIDADTIYPPSYVATLLSLFDNRDDASCAIAFTLDPLAVGGWPHWKLRMFAKLFPNKCHSGGCGQAFDRTKLITAGGFDGDGWPFVLEDHEIIHRVGKLGPILYSAELHCFPSDRRTDRSDCSWTLGERIAYKLLPDPFMDWFFYRFLARRFANRGLGTIALRHQDQWSAGKGAG